MRRAGQRGVRLSSTRCRFGELVKSRLDELVNDDIEVGRLRGEQLKSVLRYNDEGHRGLPLREP
jgi:hypothetical protein